jgi:hypothetical protein
MAPHLLGNNEPGEIISQSPPALPPLLESFTKEILEEPIVKPAKWGDKFARKYGVQIIGLLLAFLSFDVYTNTIPTDYFLLKPKVEAEFSAQKLFEEECDSRVWQPGQTEYTRELGIVLEDSNYLAYQIVADDKLEFWGTVRGNGLVNVTETPEHPIRYCGNVPSVNAVANSGKQVRFTQFAGEQFSAMVKATYDAFPNSSKFSPYRFKIISSPLRQIHAVYLEAVCSHDEKGTSCDFPGKLPDSAPFSIQLYDPGKLNENEEPTTVQLLMFKVDSPDIFGIKTPAGTNLHF